MANMPARRLLIVDDDALVRSLLRDLLSPTGCELLEAANGADALERYRLHRPHMVLLDLMMPQQSGLEALEAIRALDANARVLVISSLDAESLRKSAAAAGAIGYVVKPFHPMEVLDAVQRALAALP